MIAEHNSNSLSGKDKIKIAFVRSPRQMWPILNESDNFLLPLSYPTLAAYLRQHIPGIEISIVDCMALNMGWASLKNHLRKLQPDIVAIGEKTIYYHEGFRAFELAKEVVPDVVNIAGGVMYTSTPEWSLQQCEAIDYIALYEGEETLRELIVTLQDNKNPSGVKGIAYRDDSGKVQYTDARKLIENLDDLPQPAYDLAGLDNYKPFGKLWPKAVTVQRSRGCIANCNFCSWRIQEGRPKFDGEKYTSYQAYRTKSPGKMLDEIEWLYKNYGIRYLFWVDATWNFNSEWIMEFCEGIIKRGIELDGWWAFVRADQILENEKDGVLKYMVKAGFRHALIGAEHDSQASLDFVNKGISDYGVTERAFHLLSEKYPEVFRQATYITGLPDDTVDSIKGLVKHAHACNLDFAAFHPVAPFPGTSLYKLGFEENLIEETDYAKYDMFYPVMRTRNISREQVAEATQWCYKNFVQKKPLRYFSRMFSPYPIRRSLHRWFAFSIGRVMFNDFKNSVSKGTKFKGFSGVDTLLKPDWYDD